MATVNGPSLRRRSTLGLVKDLTHQASTLVHQEVELVKLEVHENIELAKQEMAEKGKRAGIGRRSACGGRGAVLLALGAFTAFLVLALDGVMPNWLAALCAALLWVVVAIPLALYGRKKIDEIGTPVPTRTIEAVKEDVEWLKHQTS